MNNAFSKPFLLAYWILLFGLLLSTNLLHAQSGTVSVDFKNASPKEIIENLESRTPYKFIYQNDTNLDTPRVTLKKDNVSIDDVLKELQAVTSLNFRRNENNIAVNKKSAPKKMGKIIGKAVDNTGLSLPGATIRLIETGLATISDSEGNYSFAVESGTYTVEASYMSFQTQRITGVEVSGNDATTLNIALKEDAQALDEVVITQTFQKATASVEGMLSQQRKAAQFSDGISAEQIAKTPDNEVGSTLKRITGVTTVDDKYVVVRSMGERWNQAVMDGINLPSTDAYQQHFSFDIIPTALVESVVVSKTATPDMNANFAGGYIEVKTKDIPREDFTNFTISTSYNSRSTFKDQITKQRGKNDYFGFDDGTRDFPKGLKALDVPNTEAESVPFLEQSKAFTEDNFTNHRTYTPMNSAYQFAMGRAFDLKDNSRWGFVAALNLRNTQSTQEIDHTERGTNMRNTLFFPAGTNYQDGGGGTYQYNDFRQYGFKNSGAQYTYNTTLGGMFNAGIQLGSNHRLSLRNTYLHIYENQLTQVTGWNYYNNSVSEILNGQVPPQTQTTNYPVFQDFNQNKIEGSHRFGTIAINWFGAYSHTSKDTKDATFMNASRTRLGEDELLYYAISNSANDIRRENYWNKEDDLNWGANFNWNFNVGIVKNDIKAGYFGSIKKAENMQERAALRIVGENGGSGGIANAFTPISEIVNGSNYRWGGFGWEKFAFYGNKYEGKVDMHAPFLMFDHKFGSVVRFVWGLRAESYVYKQLSSQAQDLGAIETKELDDKKWQYMPSASLTISPVSDLNIRFGYNKSVMRPQFSERLDIPYFDPVRSGVVLANWSGVVSSVSNNYDFKVEWFPTAGELLSVGVYHKDMDKPIEAINQISGDGGSRFIYNMNSHNANLSGLEFEIRKNLTFLGDGKALENIYLSGNATFNDTKVTSYVNADGTGGTYKADRPLYGQTNYAYNLGIDYTGDRFGFSARHNASGDQYLLVGFDYDAEEIRMPFSTTDAQVNWKFFKDKNLDIKFSVRNIFDSVYETYNNANSYRGELKEGYQYGDNPRDRYTLTQGAGKKYDERIDRVMFRSWVGRTMMLSINYSF